MFYQQTQSYGPPAGGESLEERRMREVILFNWYPSKDGGNNVKTKQKPIKYLSHSFLKILKIIKENVTQAREKAEREKKLREIEEMRRRVSSFSTFDTW